VNLIFALILLFKPDVFLTDNKEVIIWNNRVKLSWSDFKGTPRPGNKHVAMSKCGISMEQSGYTMPYGKPVYAFKAYFVPASSWYLKNKVSTRMLYHEQLHFDIAELYARKLRKYFSENKISPETAKQVFETIYSEYRSFQELYDTQTRHGTDLSAQKEWTKKITSKLRHLGQYN